VNGMFRYFRPYSRDVFDHAVVGLDWFSDGTLADGAMLQRMLFVMIDVDRTAA
jgi:hypothetical protein